MTTHDYIQLIAEDFRNGKHYIELKTDEPRKLYTRLRYKVYACKLHWHFQIMDESLIVRPGAARKTRKKKAEQELPHRPTCGPRCKTCGKVLYHYDKKRGECFVHAQERHIEFWNQPVRATAAQAAER